MSCCGPSRDSAELSAPDSPRRGADSPQWIDLVGGEFLMGSDDPAAYPVDGESPVRPTQVEPFAIDAVAVSNARFAHFVASTGYLTDAERYGDSLVFAGDLPANFPETRAVAATPWWRLVEGACWAAPDGPGSTVDGRADHPVVHISHRDASAFARWAGARLPTETEWEFAARGGLASQPYPWGAERDPGGQFRMNIFRGQFPDVNTAADGFASRAPVTAFSPNGFGLYNTTGNVWEWTSSAWNAGDERRVVRGGSYLCHESYCRRYRTSARSANTPDTSLSHTGFRLAR